ncbi:(2Fe-2S)-binding protein [Orrella daihaiensis]|uniref:Bacterioferritin-associated ferredoxin n=1 Tax=Orrella daihaiensis TaxID=2782176 RepID=A0ABY4ALN5_9BURK|nr:(2Fe-2S)-binding protein [Orrella daihaiensis]UOD50963.1 (2Fe-2S)-binding protein [Orrella daihaiensis]
MYVCNCAGITERDIHDAVDRGARSVKDLRRELNVAADCCQCACDVKRCLRERKALIEQVDLSNLSHLGKFSDLGLPA